MAITIKDLLEAGCHFGHQTRRWNPKMKNYVYGAKNGISIIDLTKTIRQLDEACNFVQRQIMAGANVMFVGTKRQAQQVVRDAATDTGMYFMAERWMGGTLTNNQTIKKSIRKMRDIDAIIADEANSQLKKKEIVRLSRTGLKLHRDLDGIADMRGLPDFIVVIDVCHDANAVKEARTLNIPIVGIVDTNADPELIDYPIAANDDAVKSIKVIMDTLVLAMKDALEIYKVKAAEEAKNAKPENAPQKSFDRQPRGPRTGRKPADGERRGGAPRRRPVQKELKDLSELKKSDVKPETTEETK